MPGKDQSAWQRNPKSQEDRGSPEAHETNRVANGNGDNGNGTSRLLAILPTLLAIVVTVFLGITAMTIQAIKSQGEMTDLKLQLESSKHDCEVRLLRLQRDHDRVDFEKFEESQLGLKKPKE